MSSVAPDFSTVTGATLPNLLGALLTIVLIAAVAALITSAVGWALGNASGNHHLAARAKTGLLVAIGTAAAVAGAAVAYLNWLIRLGERL